MKNLSYIPIEEATKVPERSGYWELYYCKYWVIHPEHGIAFYDPFGKGRKLSAQCNSYKDIVDRMCPKGHDVVLLERVWVLDEAESEGTEGH